MEYENFINDADIQPLGYPRGYQKELIEPPAIDESLIYRDNDGVLRTMTPEERETSIRIRRFMDDPRNLRGLIGDINLDSRGNPVSRETRAYAVQDTKERLLQNEEFNRDVATDPSKVAEHSGNMYLFIPAFLDSDETIEEYGANLSAYFDRAFEFINEQLCNRVQIRRLCIKVVIREGETS